MKRLRFPLALTAVILVTGIAVAALQPHSGPGYLDPGDAGPYGTRALAHILAQRNERVVAVNSVGQAAQATDADTTLVVTSSGFLSPAQLGTLGRLPGDLLLVEPDEPALHVLAPGISLAANDPVQARNPRCGLPAARLAGDADAGGVTLRVNVPAEQCYPTPNGPSLVRYRNAGRTITLLGTGAPLTNSNLADRGDAALSLNLLAERPVIVWLTPGTAAAGTGQTTLTSLIPRAAYLVALQLAIAVVLAAVWRARRLGPIMTEPLPVVVRAAETVEGHGRLYRSRHARDRAAGALRGAAIARLVPRLGLPAGAEPATITAAVSARSGRDAAGVDAVLFGPAPDSDGALVRLASELDTLESEVT